MKGEGNSAQDQRRCLNTLFDVIMTFNQLMAPITPFLAEHIFLNMKNGLHPDSALNEPSIHHTSVPDYEDELICQDSLRTLKRMQNAIVAGRQVRANVKLSMKYPLYTVRMIDADQKVLEGFNICQEYIKSELNCFELELLSTEDEYVQYTAEGENRALGQAFGKKYDKTFKAAVTKLTNDQIRTFLRDGEIEINGLKVIEGMLKINKLFKPEY